jgi:uncharacterized protein YjbJ (UPF0337 family)
MEMTKNNQDWNVLKGRIKTKFGKLSQDEIESFNGHLDRMSKVVTKHYTIPWKRLIENVRNL